MIIGIIGSRTRNSEEDFDSLINYLFNLVIEKKQLQLKDITIVTGDCDTGGDKFARDIIGMFECKPDIKRVKDPETGEDMDFSNHRWFDYFTMCSIFYDRNERIAKEPLDLLIALVTVDRTGGTENTIKHFKRLNKDWKKKLILL